MSPIGQPMQLSVKPHKPGAFARILAETVKTLDVNVRTSQDIGGEFKDKCDGHFEHKGCYRTEKGQEGEMVTLTENVEEICGDGAVVLMYDYEFPRISLTSPGQIRLFMRDKRRYLKYYDANGAFAFRMDSVLSHISIMSGVFPELPYGLKRGQLLLAQYTDESVKGGVYFYGSLFACPQSGQGKLKLRDAGGKTHQQVAAFCDLGIISILRVTNVKPGPKGGEKKVGAMRSGQNLEVRQPVHMWWAALLASTRTMLFII